MSGTAKRTIEVECYLYLKLTWLQLESWTRLSRTSGVRNGWGRGKGKRKRGTSRRTLNVSNFDENQSIQAQPDLRDPANHRLRRHNRTIFMERKAIGCRHTWGTNQSFWNTSNLFCIFGHGVFLRKCLSKSSRLWWIGQLVVAEILIFCWLTSQLPQQNSRQI